MQYSAASRTDVREKYAAYSSNLEAPSRLMQPQLWASRSSRRMQIQELFERAPSTWTRITLDILGEHGNFDGEPWGETNAKFEAAIYFSSSSAR
jgi:hypothetical protein